jgi:hypothetical protein
MKINRQKSPRALRIRRILMSIGLALFMFGLVCIRPAHKAEAVATFCVTDNITHDNVTFSTGGTYTFTQCSTGFTLSGTGVFSMPNGVAMVTDKKPDRSVNAGLFTGQGTGSFAIYFIPTPGGAIRVFRGNQTIPFAPCGCGF